MSLDDHLEQQADPNLLAEAKAEAEGPPEPRLRTVSVTDLLSRKPAVPVIEGLVYRDSLVQLAGDPGSYKSFITIGMACAVASGQQSWEGHRIRHSGNVVYVAAEGEQGLGLRIAAWCELSGVDVGSLNGRLIIVDGPAQMDDWEDMEALTDIINDTGAVFVVWDTRARCTIGLEENSATEQGKAISKVDEVRRATGSAQLFVHHASKSGSGGGGRGSNAWNGAIWSDLRLTKGKGSPTATIECAKHKDVPSGCSHTYDMKSVTVRQELMPNASEQQRTTLVAVTADEEGGIDPGSMTRNEERVAELLLNAGGQQGLTKSQIARFIAEEDGSEGLSSSTIYRAVHGLEKRGVIRALSPKSSRSKYVHGSIEELS